MLPIVTCFQYSISFLELRIFFRNNSTKRIYTEKPTRRSVPHTHFFFKKFPIKFGTARPLFKKGGGRGNESQKIQIHCDAMIWTHLSRSLVQQILRKVFNSSSLLLKLLGKQEKAGIDSAVAKKCSKKRRWQPLYTPHPSRKSLWLRVKRNVFLATQKSWATQKSVNSSILAQVWFSFWMSSALAVAAYFLFSNFTNWVTVLLL